MIVDKRTYEELGKLYEEGGKEEVIKQITEVVEHSEDHPLMLLLELLPDNKGNIAKVASTDDLIAHANLYIKDAGKTDYIHIKEITNHKDQIESLEAFHNKSIDEILADFQKEVEEDE